MLDNGLTANLHAASYIRLLVSSLSVLLILSVPWPLAERYAFQLWAEVIFFIWLCKSPSSSSSPGAS